MSIRIIVNGANGKMGSLAAATLNNHKDFNVVATLSRQDDLGRIIEETKAEVVLDLTTAESVYANSLTIIQQGAHPVIGTSGLQDTQIEELKRKCQKKLLGGIIVPNFSLGAVLMMQFAEQAARYISDVEIIETHHTNKLDAPSGTALKTAERIVSAKKELRKQLPLKEVLPNVRGGFYEDIPIHSLRLPGFLAKQEVIFGSLGETLTITHNTIDRACFMPGVVLACQQVKHLKGLIYGLEQVLL